MNRSLGAVAFLALGLWACSSAPATRGGVSRVQSVSSSISAAANAHSSMMGSVSNMADCMSERDRYGAQVGPMMDSLQSATSDMDACMPSNGGGAASSMTSICASMRGELQRHMGMACASATMSDDASEAALHASRMMGWAQQESDDAEGMRGMMGSGMMGDGTCGM
jgi:hypothetical protein